MKHLFLSALLVLSILMACGPHRSVGPELNKRVRSMIPPDTTIIVSGNLTVLRHSKLYDEHRADLDKLLTSQTLPLDPRTDLDRVLWLFDGKNWTAILTGNFDRQRIESSSRPETTRVVVIDRHLLVAGPLSSVDTVLKLDRERSGSVPEELQSRMQAISPGAALWAVSRGGIPLAQAPMRSDMQTNLANFTKAIESVEAAVNASDNVTLRARLFCYDEAGATRVHDALRGLLGFARLSTKDNETEMLRVYDAIDIARQASVVSVNTDLTAKQVDQLIAKALNPRLR